MQKSKYLGVSKVPVDDYCARSDVRFLDINAMLKVIIFVFEMYFIQIR
jgi:hypothetical protein